MRIVRIVSVMDPTNLWCRNHTLLMARAMCEDYDVVILTNGEWPLTAEEIAFFPVGRAPDVQDIYRYFATSWVPDDFIFYQLGNNDSFRWIAECFLIHPGAVLMHDISLFWLLSTLNGINQTFIEEEIGFTASVQLKRALDWDRPKLSMLAVHSAYFNRAILQYATGIVCHSPYQASRFRERFPGVAVDSIALVPNFLQELVPLELRTDVAEQRHSLGIDDDTITFGILGFQAFHKRLESLLDGFCALDPESRIKIFVIGRWDKEVRERCAQSLDELETRDWIVQVDRYVPEPELEKYITMSDVVTNFRYPTAGESSGIACQALSIGVPLMVNKIGSFVDLPEQSVFRIPFASDGDDRRVIGDALRELIADPSRLREKQKAARANIAHYRMPRYRRQYVGIIDNQMKTYRERLAVVTHALAIRRENDHWVDREKSASGDAAIVFDEFGNGLHLVNPVMSGIDLLTVLENDFGSNRRADRDRLAHVTGSVLRHIGRAFNLYDDEIDFSRFSFLTVAKVPQGERADFAPYLRAMKSLPIGGRVCLPADFIDKLTAAESFSGPEVGSSARAYLDALMAEVKYPGELALFRHGLNIVDDLTICERRYVVVRHGSHVTTD